jgi:hypothetical protein
MHIPFVVWHRGHDRTVFTAIGASGFYNLDITFDASGFYFLFQHFVEMFATPLFTLASTTGVQYTISFMLHSAKLMKFTLNKFIPEMSDATDH